MIEDSPTDAELLQTALTRSGPERFDVTISETLEDAAALARTRQFDLVLLDLSLPDSSGLATVVRARGEFPHLPIVVLTGAEDEAVGTEAVRMGVQDYLVKGQTGGRLLVRAIHYAIQRQRAEDEIVRMNSELEFQVRLRTLQLRRLASELTLAEQRERRRLADILHDHLQQLLVFSKLTLSSIEAPEGDGETLRRVEKALGEAIELARSLSADLSPPTLYEHGLAAALTWLGRSAAEKYGLQVRVAVPEESEPIAEGIRVLLFQSVQELLFNVMKHAGVKEAEVHMVRSEDGGIRINVNDAGAGCDPDRLLGSKTGEGGFGLFSIRERLDLLGGHFGVESAAGRGCRVTLVVPGPALLAGAEGGGGAEAS